MKRYRVAIDGQVYWFDDEQRARDKYTDLLVSAPPYVDVTFDIEQL